MILKYVPVFRSRQQENLVLKSFDFGQNIYPLIEIIKEHDRARSPEVQSSMGVIYGELIKEINAEKVFLDLPIYLKERPSMKKEVLEFSRIYCADRVKRTEFMLSMSDLSGKIIPVISSYMHRTGEVGSISMQFSELKDAYGSICFRSIYNHFVDDWNEIKSLIRETDYIVLDLDVLPPYPSPAIKRIINIWSEIQRCCKIVVRSAINNEIQNVSLNHGDVIYDADNNLLQTFRTIFCADAFGDYVGVKKDDLSSGGTISPGFIMYDPIGNQYIGFKGQVKNLAEFESTIVPDVMSSQWIQEIRKSNYGYLDDMNQGWKILERIRDGEESGKSQAKFKRIAMEHYLYCVKKKIDKGEIN